MRTDPEAQAGSGIMEVSKSKSMKSRCGRAIAQEQGGSRFTVLECRAGPRPYPGAHIPYFQFFRPQCCTRTLLDLTFSCRGYAHGMVRRRDEPRPPTPREPSRALPSPRLGRPPPRDGRQTDQVCGGASGPGLPGLQARVPRARPCILVKCVHTFCRGCIEELIRTALHIEELIREGGTCPLDGQECDSAQLVLNRPSSDRCVCACVCVGVYIRVCVCVCVYHSVCTLQQQ